MRGRRGLGGVRPKCESVKKCVNTVKDTGKTTQVVSLARPSKKEEGGRQREMDKLQRSLSGIKDLGSRPDALFVIDVGYHKGAITEANKLGIPVVAVVDTNHSPEGIDYVIPGNDDSSRAIRLYARGVADAVLEGRTQSVERVIAASRDEFVEVNDEVGA